MTEDEELLILGGEDGCSHRSFLDVGHVGHVGVVVEDHGGHCCNWLCLLDCDKSLNKKVFQFFCNVVGVAVYNIYNG